VKRARLFKRSRVQRRRPHRLVAGIRARAGKVQKTDGLSMMQEVGSVLAVGAVVTYSDTSSSSGVCGKQGSPACRHLDDFASASAVRDGRSASSASRSR